MTKRRPNEMDPTQKQEGLGRQDAKPLDPEALVHHANEGSPLPIVLTRGEMHVVKCANLAFCRLIGKSPKEIEGKALITFFKDAGFLTDLLDRVYRSGVTDFASDREYIISDGTSGHCTAIACPIFDAEGHQDG